MLAAWRIPWPLVGVLAACSGPPVPNTPGATAPGDSVQLLTPASLGSRAFVTNTARTLESIVEDCNRGKADACSDLGVSFDLGISAPKNPETARALYEKACKAGSMSGCNNLGVMVLVSDPPRAASSFDRACRSRLPIACRNLGMAYLVGSGVERDVDRSRELFLGACQKKIELACVDLARVQDDAGAERALTQSCARGTGSACADLGRLLAPSQPKRANSVFTRACTAGDPSACAELALCAIRGIGELKNVSKGVTFLDQACNLKSAPSCDSLGMLLASGETGLTDVDRAQKYFQMACDLGDDRGCVHVAQSMFDGHGDEKQAFLLSARGCAQGLADGCSQQGHALLVGVGTEKDASRARAPLEFACEEAIASACHDLGTIYETAEDFDEAASLYTQACDAGVAPACQRLAVLYWHGSGVAKDETHARELLETACSGGVAEACEFLERE